MKQINNWEKVQANEDFKSIPAGGYVCQITGVEDVPLDATTGKGDYLKLEFEIIEGEYENYFANMHNNLGWDSGNFIRSYKEKALGMFKAFLNTVEISNPGYTWAWDEKTLVGKNVGIILGEEEYIKNNGSVGKRIVVKNTKSVEDIRKGNFRIPEVKKIGLEQLANAPVISGNSDQDIPF